MAQTNHRELRKTDDDTLRFRNHSRESSCMRQAMKSMLKLIFIFLLLGMSATNAQSAGEPKAMPFHISSRGSAYGVQGEFEGTYRVYNSSIEVYVSKATLSVSEHC